VTVDANNTRAKRLAVAVASFGVLVVLLGMVGVSAHAGVTPRPASSGAAKSPTRTLSTGGAVTLLAADGPLAAAVVKGVGNPLCTKVLFWRPGSPATVVGATAECAVEGQVSVLGSNVAGLALGGKRVVWQEIDGGNFLEMVVRTATTSKPTAKELSIASNYDGAGMDPGGDYNGHLLADGPLLVFASWKHCTREIEVDPNGVVIPDFDGRAQCATDKPDVSSGVLHQVVAGKNKVLRRGDEVLDPVWVDGGRILVRTRDSKLALLRSSGGTLLSFDVGMGYETALFQGKRLVVLRRTALDVYDTGTGAKTTSFALSAKPRQLVDVQSGIAVLIADGAVHLIKLDTAKGAGATVKPPAGGAISAQLEPAGLFYASRAGLGFVPMPEVLKRFR